MSDAYYCKECTILEKDVRGGGEACFRSSAPLPLCPSAPLLLLLLSLSVQRTLQRDGCPKIVNLGSSKVDLFYERKKYGFKKR